MKNYPMADITTGTKASDYNGWWIGFGYNSNMVDNEPVIMCLVKYDAKPETAKKSTTCSVQKFAVGSKTQQKGVEALKNAIAIKVDETALEYVTDAASAKQSVNLQIKISYKYTEATDLAAIRKDHFGKKVPVILAYG